MLSFDDPNSSESPIRAIEYTDYISAEGCDTKSSDGEVQAQELWGIRSTPLLPLLPGLL